MPYPELFSPCKIGGLELKNRVVMPPMSTDYAREGFVTEVMLTYYAERARGGVGLIVTEDASIDSATGRRAREDLFGDDDRYIPGLKRLAKAIKGGGALAALNLSHGGRQSARAMAALGKTAVAPSAVPGPECGIPGVNIGVPPPRALEIEEIVGLEDRFAEAARRARSAGFDMVSLHAAHSYLINQFLSPAFNRRDDEYGKDASGRHRFLLNIIRKVKEEAGADFPVMVRIPGAEQAEGGLSVSDCQEIARNLEQAGVACISVSVDLGARSLHIPPPVAPMRFPRGCMVHLARPIKQVVSVPVMTANRIVKPAMAERIITRGHADLIGIGRGLIADPEWPEKAQDGREEDIRHCIACMHCSGAGLDMRCTVNAAAGRELEFKLSAASNPRRVFVAGGGPAGLEAARVLALRGHEVSLFEKGRLGGQINLACLPPHKRELKLLAGYQRGQLKKLAIGVRRKMLTPAIVAEGKPDAVVIATGACPSVPDIPGIKLPHVLQAWDVLQGKGDLKSPIAVLGGGQLGAETAEYIVRHGHQVFLVGRRPEIAGDERGVTRSFLLASLAGSEVRMMPGWTVIEIVDSAVIIEQNGQRERLPAATVVLAFKPRPDRSLADQLAATGVTAVSVGDCNGVRKLHDAIEEGFRAGLAT